MGKNNTSLMLKILVFFLLTLNFNIAFSSGEDEIAPIEKGSLNRVSDNGRAILESNLRFIREWEDFLASTVLKPETTRQSEGLPLCSLPSIDYDSLHESINFFKLLNIHVEPNEESLGNLKKHARKILNYFSNRKHPE